MLRNEVFMRDSIPLWLACGGYLFLCVVSTIVIPMMFPELKWYYVLVSYVLVPGLSFCNAYGAGLTNMNMAGNYGKVALFVLAAMAGKENGVVAGLVGLSVIKSAIATSGELIHDFRTAYLTLTSPRSMLAAQAVGTAIGCIVGPLTFFVFYRSFDVGDPDGVYKAPYAIIYRNMAILGVEGFSALPDHCLELCCGFFLLGVAMNVVRDLAPERLGRFVPIPMAMAAPFFLGAYFTIDMALGSAVGYLMRKRMGDKEAAAMVPSVGAGLICGDGLWTFPAFIMTLAKINPPMCMSFSPALNS
ncbi:hypothetical protein M569_16663 [Genlisea aurea]|uniref:Uncharacterized protein n=1 Tax=Genlisea aurea TaxID=192259 RepID=S8D663_9LAMI|nr:hypothetical protein M569_16663 [Genlisea aurea]